MDPIERLIAIEAIRALKARYCRLADRRAWAQLAALFTPDGSMAFFAPSGDLMSKLDGQAQIGAQLAQSVGTAQPIHHVFTGEIDIRSPTEAAAVWAMEDLIFRRLGDDAGYRTMHGFGHYHETYSAIGGEWRIATLELKRLKLDFT